MNELFTQNDKIHRRDDIGIRLSLEQLRAIYISLDYTNDFLLGNFSNLSEQINKLRATIDSLLSSFDGISFSICDEDIRNDEK